ncbi:MAG: hypothetical protein M0D53_12865 [Flavobacterium sp. JAD_PAG50586_2]|nr:MAG: hypothetical protein M0D53_12865 [Flavobacterium sp. JAD_PAG50586_2]
MADGLLNKKIAFIIQARMQSTRLPGKIFMPLPFNSDVPLLGRIVNVLKTSKTNHTIIVATSSNPENDLLEVFCKEYEIACFRGSEDDVLSRFTTLLYNSDFDVVVRLTADNPFVDAELLDKALEEHLVSEADYSFTKGLPLGMNLEIISASAIQSLASKELNDQEKEHVTLYIRNSGLYSVNCIESFAKESYKSLRLTVDYPSDYLVASALLDLHLKTGIAIGSKLVDYCLEHHPWIFEANRNNFQKGNYTSLADEIQNVKPILEQLEFEKVLTLLASQLPKE